MKLSDHLDRRLVRVPLAASNRDEAITELVGLVAANGMTSDGPRLLECVMTRERQRTTAVGRGLALPHAKCDACAQMVVAVGTTATPIEFQAIDGKPVRLIVLLACPLSQASVQIQLLARISKLAMDEAALRRVIEAASADELLEAVRSHEGGTA